VDDTPVRTDGAHLPSLRDMAMTYLHAHSYNIILHIVTSYQSSDTVDDFALGLAFQGLPITKGQYIWYIIKNHQKRTAELVLLVDILLLWYYRHNCYNIFLS
jgi:hypothetical protein